MPPTRLRTWTLLLAALTLGLSLAHLLELPQKLGWDATRWVEIEHTLYRWFGIVGGPLEVAAVIAAAVLAVRCARSGLPSGGARAAAVLFALALAEWALVVQTANNHIGQWDVAAIPADWSRWRSQWEWGHAGHFVLWLAGFVVLLGGSVRGAAARPGREPARGGGRTRP